MNTIAHIINPFKADKLSDLFIAQPITFESIVNAKEKAKNVVKIELLSAQFEEDSSFIPNDFKQTKHLTQSVLDKHSFLTKIKLPLLFDILERLYLESEAEYLIYSNMDIGLYPDFYLQVNAFINQGYDAFIINRRRLPSKYSKPSELSAIYEDRGKPHPGFDCFIFHRSIFPKLKLEGICIGVPFIEISFSQNLFALSKHFKLFDKEILTFHIGEEIFKKRAPKEYFKYNQNQFWKLVPLLEKEMDLKKFPYHNLFFPFRIIKWGLHPCIPIRLVMQLEWKRLWNR
jgi:hypothetical protein